MSNIPRFDFIVSRILLPISRICMVPKLPCTIFPCVRQWLSRGSKLFRKSTKINSITKEKYNFVDNGPIHTMFC